MFKETAQVIDVQEGKVKIKFEKKSMCSCCRYTALCGGADEFVTVENSLGALDKGDAVEVGIEEKKTVLASILTFLAPAIVFLFSLIVLRDISQLTSFFLAICAVMVYYLILKMVLRRKGSYFNIKILRKVHNG